MTVQPTFDLIDAWPSSSVAAGGTILFAYPTGRNYRSYDAASASLSVPGFQSIYTAASGKITVSLTTIGAVVTLVSVPPIPAGARATLGLEVDLPVASEPATVGDAIDSAGSLSPTLGFAGHSVPAAGVSNIANQIRNSAYGMFHWVPMLTKQAVESNQGWVIATPGLSTLGLVNRIPEILATPADNWIVDIGTNDTAFANYANNVPTVWDAILNRGGRVIAIPVMPRSLASQANRDMYQNMNAWCREKGTLGIKNFHVVDVSVEYGDPTSALWAPKSDAGNTYDTLHPSNLGGYRVSKDPAALLRSWYPARRNISGIASQWSADNPRGNILPNGAFTGTAGTGSTAQGITATAGAIPDGWAIFATAPYSGGSAFTGFTVATTTLTDPDGTKVVQLTYSGGYTGDVDTFAGLRYLMVAGDYTKFAPGDWSRPAPRSRCSPARFPPSSQASSLA